MPSSSPDAPGQTHVAIVGGGPIGLELAAGLKHAGVDYVHFEAGAIGSTLMWWAPQTRFFSSPERLALADVPLTSIDQAKTSREEYLAYLRGFAQQFDLRVHAHTHVDQIVRRNGEFELITHASMNGVGGPAKVVEHAMGDAKPQTAAENNQALQKWRAKHVVLAIGNMHRPRMLNVPGESLPQVSHYLNDSHMYFGSRVLIVGGKNSAVEAALRLYRIGAKVIMSYRGDSFDPKRIKYWLRPELEWLISKKHVEFYPRTLVHQIHPGTVEMIGCDDPNRTISIDADFVLLLTGYVQDTQLFEQLGVELQGDERAPKFDLDTMQTNVPGVYVAGTAAGGSQKRARLFIENSHVHVRRIVKHIAGVDLPWHGDEQYAALEES